ncbi:MAG TPA: SDR family NAD(P)-dependent oxidoreductase [Burkholderiaceae bacterium]|nr:SDR family NAD(P)-dependent oxidoreductase [Burkholderiaceae bacterium]
MRLAGRVAVITGAAQGIGAACAQVLASEGARLVLADVQAGKVQALAATLAAQGVQVSWQGVDVGDGAQVQVMVQHAVAQWGRVDVLVNNAGIVHAADFLDLTEDDFDRVLRVNLKGAFLCAQAVARQMVAQPELTGAAQRGVIVNVSSVNAVLAIANQVPYTVSKGGLAQLTKVMALSLAPRGLRVCAVGPGSIATELLQQAVLTDPAANARILSRTPLGRLGQPQEVAKVVAFLASDDASYLTGSTLYPDGGRLALNYVM